MARAAYQLALASPRVRAEVIEVNEFPELADRYGVRAVPLTVINDQVAIPGAVTEQVLVEQVLKAAESALAGPPAEGARGSATPLQREEPLRRGQQRQSGLYIP